MIRAVTFDLWDTLVVDDSDEEVRAASGRPSKVDERREVFVSEVLRHHDLPSQVVADALEAANATFRHQWKVEHRTPHIRERLKDAYGRLSLAPTPGFDALVEHFASMEVLTPPRPTPGVVEALESLHGKFKLGIISDAIVTPGTHLRRILAHHNLLRFFSVFVFSDEAGASKPSARVFELAAHGFGVQLEEIAHVGDRESNDVAGPQAVGAKGILYTGAVDRGAAESKADAVCADLRALPGILADWRHG